MATLVRGRNSILTHPTIFAFLCPINAHTHTQTLIIQNIFRKMGIDWEVWKWAVESGNVSWWRQDMHFNSLIHYWKKVAFQIEASSNLMKRPFRFYEKITNSLLVIFQSYRLCIYKKFKYSILVYQKYRNIVINHT